MAAAIRKKGRMFPAAGMLQLLTVLFSILAVPVISDARSRQLSTDPNRPNVRMAVLVPQDYQERHVTDILTGPILNFVNGKGIPLGNTTFGMEIHVFVLGTGSSSDPLLTQALDRIGNEQDAAGNTVGPYHLVTDGIQVGDSRSLLFSTAASQTIPYINCGLARRSQYGVTYRQYSLALNLPSMVYLRDPIRNAQTRGMDTLAIVMTTDSQDLYEMAMGAIAYALDSRRARPFVLMGPTADWCVNYAHLTQFCELRPPQEVNGSEWCGCGNLNDPAWTQIEQWLIVEGITADTASGANRKLKVYEMSEQYITGTTPGPADYQVMDPAVFDFGMAILEDLHAQACCGWTSSPDVLINGILRYTHLIYALFYMEFNNPQTPLPWKPVRVNVGWFGDQPDGRILPSHWKNGSSMIGWDPWGTYAQDMMTAWSLSVGAWHHRVSFGDALFGSTDDLKALLAGEPNYNVLSPDLACLASVISLVFLAGNKWYVGDDFGSKTVQDQRDDFSTAFSTTNDENMWGTIRFNRGNMNYGRGPITWQAREAQWFGGLSTSTVLFPTVLQDRPWVIPYPTWDSRFNCSPGYYNNETDCLPCPIGKYAAEQSIFWGSNNSEAELCKLCGPGEEARSPGATACTLCPAGWYRESGMLVEDDFGVDREGICAKCKTGRAQSLEGQTFCSGCLQGTAASVEGLPECTPCDVGYFQQTLAETGCEACPAGKYAEQTGMSFCESCEIGSYQGKDGESVCLPCNDIMSGSTTQTRDKTSPLDCGCPAGTLDPRTYGLPVSHGCQSCLANGEGVICLGFGTYKCRHGNFTPSCSCSGDEPVCTDGPCPSWLDCSPVDNTPRDCPAIPNLGTTVTAEEVLGRCSFSHKCMWDLALCPDMTNPVVSSRETLDEDYFETFLPAEFDGDELVLDDRVNVLNGVWECQSLIACPGQSGDVTAEICGQHREGLNCGKCKKGYASSGGASTECGKCNFWFLLLIPFVTVTFYSAAGLFHYLWNEREKLIEGVEPVLASVTIDIALSFIQSLGIFEKMTIAWPEAFQEILAIAKFFLIDIDVLRPGCLFPQTLSGSYLGRLSTPIILSLIFLTWWPMSRLLHRFTNGKFKRYNIWAMMNTVGMIVQALYISLVTTAVSLVECYQSPNELKSIRSYTFAQCPTQATLDFGDQPEFMAMIPFFVLALMIYVIGIFGLFVYLSIQAPKKLDDPNFRKATRFLVFQLQPAMWWYQVILMARSALLALVPVFSPDDGYVQVLMFASVLLTSLVAHMALWPFSERMANLLEVWDVSLLMGMLVVACWFCFNKPNDSQIYSRRLGMILIALVIAVIGAVIVCVAYGVWESFNQEKVNRHHTKSVHGRLAAIRQAVMALQAKGDDGLRDFLLSLSYVDLWHLERLAHLAMLELCGLMPVKLSERRLSRQSASFQLASTENLRALEEAAQKQIVEKLSKSFDKEANNNDGRGSNLEWDATGEAEVWV